jgi:hypothetical protein
MEGGMSGELKKWQCFFCGYIYDEAPRTHASGRYNTPLTGPELVRGVSPGGM